MKTKWWSARMMAEIAILSAIAFAMDFLQAGYSRGLFANGGSIGLAMVPILILSYRRGFRAGMLGAFIVSFLQMLGGVYAIGGNVFAVISQILLDYVLAYPAVALAGIFYASFQKDQGKGIKWIVIGTVVGGVMKFMCHFLAGFIFWADNTPANFLGGPVVYSLAYNGGYMLPNIIIAIALLVVIYIKMPKIFSPKNEGGVSND